MPDNSVPMRAHTNSGSGAAAGPGTYALFILLAVLMVMVILWGVADVCYVLYSLLMAPPVSDPAALNSAHTLLGK